MDSTRTDVTSIVTLYTDGGSRGNPGPSAIAAVVLDSKGSELARRAETIGETTNNCAEYRALILGLDLCQDLKARRVACHSDSQLLVNQLHGVWRVKSEPLAALFDEVQRRLSRFHEVTFTHVRRTDPNISVVDRLLNDALDRRQ